MGVRKVLRTIYRGALGVFFFASFIKDVILISVILLALMLNLNWILVFTCAAIASLVLNFLAYALLR